MAEQLVTKAVILNEFEKIIYWSHYFTQKNIT
jgi:hypothetical protein